MASKSAIEEKLAQALDFVMRDTNRPWRYGPPEREYPVSEPCCPHAKRMHRALLGSVACVTCRPPGSVHEYVPRYRFDFAWPAYQVAVECNGGIYSGGAHGRPTNIVRDYAKGTQAQLAGWLVLPIVGAQVADRGPRSGEAIHLLERALAQRAALVHAPVDNHVENLFPTGG